MTTATQKNPAEIRNVQECENLAPVFLEKNEHWQCVKGGKLSTLTLNIKEGAGVENLPESWKKYPLNWSKGGSLIFVVQAEYWQQEDEEGNKGQGYCRTLYFFNEGTPLNIVKGIAKGTHPTNYGYNLAPII